MKFPHRPNYLVYVNTLLFYRVGGGTRIAGFLLAVATMVLLLIGAGPIAYIRTSSLETDPSYQGDLRACL
jgi:MFS superfamily sulfate permease-like transporter